MLEIKITCCQDCLFIQKIEHPYISDFEAHYALSCKLTDYIIENKTDSSNLEELKKLQETLLDYFLEDEPTPKRIPNYIPFGCPLREHNINLSMPLDVSMAIEM